MAQITIQTKLKLNNCQRTLVSRHAGFCRWVYNWGLVLREKAFSEGIKVSGYKLRKLFTNHVKPDFPWMSELSSRIYQYAFQRLDEAYQRFFKGLSGRPKLKKKGREDSFDIDNHGEPIEVGGKKIRLPKLGWLRTYESLPKGKTKHATIFRKADSWYINFAIEVPDWELTLKTVERVGVDLGVKHLAILSTGIVFPNPRAYPKAKSKLAKLQRKLSRKNKGSRGWNKTVVQLARQHRRVVNIRNDNVNKITTYLAKTHSQVVIEDLNVVGLLKGRRMAESLQDCSLGRFRRLMEYKCKRYGTELIVADKFYPSSQLCSCCGYRQKLKLSQRVYDCPKCGLIIDRDLNAAINLANWGRSSPGSSLRDNRSHAPREARSKRRKRSTCTQYNQLNLFG